MKARLSRQSLEMALAKCYDVCEKKSSDSLVQFVFEENKLSLYSKGSFAYIQVHVDVTSDVVCDFTLKTAPILDFVKYIDAEELLLMFDTEKKSCMISSADKKSKIAFQSSSESMKDTADSTYEANFSLDDSFDFVNKLSSAAKFCSNNVQEHPLTAIHCEVKKSVFKIKSANGPVFFETSSAIKSEDSFEFYLHKKSSNILRSIFTEPSIKCSVNKNHFLVETNKCKLKIFIENSDKNSFPSQVTSWLDKKEDCSVKVSAHDLTKTLKYLGGLIDGAPIKITCKDNKLSLESNQANMAVKEIIATEEQNGEATSDFNIKSFLDCVESFQSSWIKLHFIEMQSDFYLCKLTGTNTVSLLCPVVS